MAIHKVAAPVAGIFYCRPSPDKPPFKAAGEAISVGETVGLIEVMKSFFPLEAEIAGRLVRFLAADGAEIEAGDALAEIDSR